MPAKGAAVAGMCALFQEHRRKVSAQLFDAIRMKDLKLAKKYIEDGAEMDFRDKWGDTALHQCAVYVRTRPSAFVCMLVNVQRCTRLAQLTFEPPVAQQCTLDKRYNQADIAKELAFHRADPNAENNMGMTPLMVVRPCMERSVCAACTMEVVFCGAVH